MSGGTDVIERFCLYILCVVLKLKVNSPQYVILVLRYVVTFTYCFPI